MAEKKIEEIEKGPEDKAEKTPSSPQEKAKGKRSEPKASPKSRGRKAETTKSEKSPSKTGKSKEDKSDDKSELKEASSKTPQKKGKKNEKIEDEDLPKAKKEKKMEVPSPAGRKRKEVTKPPTAKAPPPKKGKKTETKRTKEIDADAAFVMSASDDEEMVEEMETEDPNEAQKHWIRFGGTVLSTCFFCLMFHPSLTEEFQFLLWFIHTYLNKKGVWNRSTLEGGFFATIFLNYIENTCVDLIFQAPQDCNSFA